MHSTSHIQVLKNNIFFFSRQCDIKNKRIVYQIIPIAITNKTDKAYELYII